MRCIFITMVCLFCIHNINARFYNDGKRDITFETYYGLSDGLIERVLSPNEHLGDTPFFDTIIPSTGSSKGSLILFAKKGDGKTSILRHFKKKISKEGSVLIVEPIENPSDLQLAFQTFVANKKDSILDKDLDDYSLINQNWQDRDMVDFVIAQITQVMLENFSELDLCKLDIDEIEKLVLIIFLYNPISFNNFIKKIQEFQEESMFCIGSHKIRKYLENWINIFSRKKKIQNFANNEIYSNQNLNCKESLDDNYLNNALLSFLDDIDVIDHNTYFNNKNFDFLNDFGIKSTNLFFIKNVSPNHKEVLQIYIKIIKKMGVNTVLAFDEFNKVPDLALDDEKCSNDIFKAIMKSMSPIIDIAISQVIRLFIFIQNCEDFDRQIFENLSTQGKILVYQLSWSTEAFETYGYFLFDFLKTNQNSYFGCSLPNSIAEFMGGKECFKLFLSQIYKPGDFKNLFLKFIEQLNTGNLGIVNSSDKKEDVDICKVFPPLFIGEKSCATVKEVLKKFTNYIEDDLIHDEL